MDKKRYQKLIINEAKKKRKENRIKVITGEKIRKLRKDRNISLKDLSLKTGIQIATLSRIESGLRSGTLEIHAQIAQEFKIELFELFKDAKILKTHE